MKKLLLSALMLGAGAAMASADIFEVYIGNQLEEDEIHVANYQLVTEGGVYQANYHINGTDIESSVYLKIKNLTSSPLTQMNATIVPTIETNAAELNADYGYSVCFLGGCKMNPTSFGLDGEPIPANGETGGGWGEHDAYEIYCNSEEDAKKIKLDARHNWTLSSGNQTIHFTVEFKSDSSTGINGMEVDNATPEYFNLQGIRVATPEAGRLYIKRQGGKASKVIF